MTKIFSLILILVSLKSFASLETYEKKVSNGSVTFVKDSSMSAEDFSKSNYALKPDPAWLQTNYPLTMDQRKALSSNDFLNMTQEEIDQVYIRLSSGPIRPGDYQGTVVQRIELVKQLKEKFMTKYKGIEMFGQAVCGDRDIVECLAEMIWKGKRIYKPDSSTCRDSSKQTCEYLLKNALDPILAKGIQFAISPLFSPLLPENWLSPTLSSFYGMPRNMLFPAKVYCGQSLFDHRKESVIIDYAYGDDFKPFIKGIDDLAGREFMNIRDEVRMIRPGLYLGRAYTNKIFLLNFVLYNPDHDTGSGDLPKDQCFNGTTTR
jgi:hypothetical protein